MKSAQEARARIADRRKEAELNAITKRKEAMARKNPALSTQVKINRGPVPADASDPRINRGPAPIAKGGAVKKPVKKMGGGMMYANGGKPDKFAQGGAGKVRKGMMTPEGKIIHAMNKVRGK
jgi:hypothetical protein